MESHDPLCYRHAEGKRRPLIDCDCRIITLARADEREMIAQAIEADEWIIGRHLAARIARGGSDE